MKLLAQVFCFCFLFSSKATWRFLSFPSKAQVAFIAGYGLVAAAHRWYRVTGCQFPRSLFPVRENDSRFELRS